MYLQTVWMQQNAKKIIYSASQLKMSNLLDNRKCCERHNVVNDSYYNVSLIEKAIFMPAGELRPEAPLPCRESIKLPLEIIT
jgi:hypothetical protein